MGDESKDWEVWLDEYNQSMSNIGDITINLSDYYEGSDSTIDLSNITLDNGWVDYKDWSYGTNNHNNNITLTGGGEEMLRVAEDGFYIRGVRVEADAKEAEHVYKAFKEWLTWNSLTNRNY